MFYIQDPSFSGNKLLHEALLDAFGNALYGAGAYAFVTASGINMLMGDHMFRDFISRGKYHLVIGMDDITNTKTLDALAHIQKKSNHHLLLSAFVSEDNNSTFHPKFSWFRTETGGIIVVGSGNMTLKGLRRNREAFIFQKVSKSEIDKIESDWNKWLNEKKSLLKQITDSDVTERAEQNSKRTSYHPIYKKISLSKTKAEIAISVPIDEQDEPDAWTYGLNSQVLIAEIPGNSNNRWSQANFDAKTFRDYFGGFPGVNGVYRSIMRNVHWDGKLGEIKVRPTISVASKNYRIELENPDKQPYPLKGRPIGVFVKITERTFLYIIVFPQHEGHRKLSELMNKHRERTDRLTRYITTVTELQAAVPTLPLLYYLA